MKLKRSLTIIEIKIINVLLVLAQKFYSHLLRFKVKSKFI
jgi:hypothetical protein